MQSSLIMDVNLGVEKRSYQGDFFVDHVVDFGRTLDFQYSGVSMLINCLTQERYQLQN